MATRVHVYAYALFGGRPFRTRMTIGVQTFELQPDRVSEEEAVWMGDMLEKALRRAGVTDISREAPKESE